MPLAFGQGPGNALSWDINFTNTPAAQFAGNGSFGLSLASIGFVVASVFGVLYINIYKRRSNLKVRTGKAVEKLGIQQYQTLMPIPAAERQANRNLTQNPGY